MVTKKQQPKIKSTTLSFDPTASVTSFGGIAVASRVMEKLGLGALLAAHLPARRGYSLCNVAISTIAGLLTGARGTVASEAVRHDPALLRLLGLTCAPEEATLWRALHSAGATEALAAFDKICSKLALRAIERSSRKALFDQSGFIPVFIDGTLLEGSRRREGTKFVEKKGLGLTWTAGFVGPFPVAQSLAAAGEGESETTHARALFTRIERDVLAPAGLRKDALLLMDSLHGNGETLDLIEGKELLYVIGANNLKRTAAVLAEQPESQWTPCPEHDCEKRGIEQSAVCVASVMCENWKHKRILIGRRWKQKGDFVWHYSGVMTNISIDDERLGGCADHADFALKIWRLYSRKGACENHFKSLLIDLGLHHPPCQQWQRNAGFYAMGFLAGLIAVATDVLTSAPADARRRIATLRRWVFAIPARISSHARTAKVTIVGLSDWWRDQINKQFARAALC